jgi:hypothetical protein
MVKFRNGAFQSLLVAHSLRHAEKTADRIKQATLPCVKRFADKGRQASRPFRRCKAFMRAWHELQIGMLPSLASSTVAT